MDAPEHLAAAASPVPLAAEPAELRCLPGRHTSQFNHKSSGWICFKIVLLCYNDVVLPTGTVFGWICFKIVLLCYRIVDNIPCFHPINWILYGAFSPSFYLTFSSVAYGTFVCLPLPAARFTRSCPHKGVIQALFFHSGSDYCPRDNQADSCCNRRQSDHLIIKIELFFLLRIYEVK